MIKGTVSLDFRAPALKIKNNSISSSLFFCKQKEFANIVVNDFALLSYSALSGATLSQFILVFLFIVCGVKGAGGVASGGEGAVERLLL